MKTEILDGASGVAIEQAAALLARGEVVALPTETVYGLAGHALSPEAAARIFEAKDRPRFDPLIVHLPGLDWLERLTTAAQHPLLRSLVECFWPGPLTLVLPRREVVPDIVTSGLPTVAVRMSAHPVFQAVLQRLVQPLAAPSANRFGRISPTTAAHVVSELGGRIPLVLDGGPARLGVESTVVAIDGDSLRILRQGPITAEELATFARISTEASPLVEAPGQLQSHYAPGTPFDLLETASESAHWSGRGRIGLLAWTREIRPAPFAAMETLSPRGDLREAAANLFAAMRRLDELGLDGILAEPVPANGLGAAIMDRLRKASVRL